MSLGAGERNWSVVLKRERSPKRREYPPSPTGRAAEGGGYRGAAPDGSTTEVGRLGESSRSLTHRAGRRGLSTDL